MPHLCTICGANMDLVGRSHRCIPKKAIPVLAAKPLNPKPPRSPAAAKEGGRTVGSIPATGAKRGRGRPRVEGKRPWETEGLSRRTWYRRKAEQKAEK